MLTAAIDGLVERFGLEGERVGEVVAGAVLKHARDFNLTRESVLGSRLAPETPATDIQQACGTGLQAAIQVANKIALGQIDVGIAGGTDTTSDAPIAVGEGLRKILLELNRAKDVKARLAALAKLRPGDIVPAIPQNGEPRTRLSMGEHAALTAAGVEDRPRGAGRARGRLPPAPRRGVRPGASSTTRSRRSTVWSATRTCARTPRRRSSPRLKPVFGRGSAATMTAGNSTPLTDGASVVLLASEEWAAARGLPVLAYLTDYETAAVDYVHGHEGLLMAPAYAMPRMLARQGLTLQDFDFYEIHEAFASQVLATLKAWEDPVFCAERLGLEAPLGAIDRSRLNVAGSSLAAGHPFAATGGRILTVLAKLLAEKGSGRGVVSMCAAGGQGVTAILERP